LLTSIATPTSPSLKIPEPTDFPEDKVEKVDEGNEEYKYEKSFVLHLDRKNLDRRHVIIPFDELINFMDSNFVCKVCPLSKSTYQRQMLVIVTSLNWFCACWAGGAIKAWLQKNDVQLRKML
jgi:hypothetical protein